MSFIYKIINNKNNMIYVGKTIKSIEERWKLHTSCKKSQKNRYLYRAILKYGKDSFSIEIIETVENNKNLNEREKFWINELNSLIPHGYNMTLGGDGGDTSNSINYKKGMKQRRTYKGEFNPMFGKIGEESPNYGSKRSNEQKKRIAKGLKQKWDNNSKRKKELSKNVTGDKNPMYGKKPANALLLELDNEIYYSMQDAINHSGKSITYIKKNRKIIGKKDERKNKQGDNA